MSSFKILSWNIRQGGGTRIGKIVEALAEHAAHVIVLSEFRNSQRGKDLMSLLKSAGYEQFATTNAAANENSVMIAAKTSFEKVPIEKPCSAYPHSMLHVRFPAFDLLGMYLPHKKKHTWFDWMIERVSKLPPAVLAGDFNSGKNGIDQKGNSFWYEDKLCALEELEFVDAFRSVHGDEREYSWFSHHGNGFRYDHTYVHRAIEKLTADCYYSHTEREANISDHSAMILELAAR